MSRFTLTLAIIVLASAGLRADVTVTTTTTASGQLAAFGAGALPHATMRIQGSRERIDVEVMGQRLSQILDLATRQSILLNHADKTATIVNASMLPSSGAGSAPKATPRLDVHVEHTGRTEEIEGQTCDEFTMSLKTDFAGASMTSLPAGAAEMLKDVKVAINGVIWVATSAPGAAEYSAFQKAAREANLWVGPSNLGLRPPRESDPSFAVLDYAQGIPYLSELETVFDGSGQVVEMMKQMGGLKMTSRVTAVSVEPIAADVFEIPADYTLNKR